VSCVGLPSEREVEFGERPANHHYCFGLIRLFLELVLQAASSLGAASASLKLMRAFLPGVIGVPTDDCGQLWLLRVGLYEVTRSKDKTDDRIWIVDHTIQIGITKCLLIVSCRLSWWQQQRGPLSHRDLEVLALEPTAKSDGQVVQQQLEKTAAKAGVPRGIVSDDGSDLKRGIEAFQEDHPETARIYDIAHKTAILVKQELEADERWSQYLKQIGQAKQLLQQTSLAFLTPPTPKNKARYMNLETLVTWGRKALAYLDDPRPVTDEGVNKKKLRKNLGWLRQYRSALARWHAMMRTVATTLEYVRQEGYHRRASQQLGRKLKPITTDRQSCRLADRILAFVGEQSRLAGRDEHLIGSSECIESLIGRGKRLERQQSKSGFTRMVLAMAAAVVNPTKEYVERALANVKTRDVYQWCRDQLGVSVQSQRRQAFAGLTSGTKTG
jgi:hypothetical protein